MKLDIYKPLWGHTGSLTEAIDQAEFAGFDGIEGTVPKEPGNRAIFMGQLEAADLKMIAEVYTGGWYVPSPKASVQEHLDDLRSGIEDSLPVEPVFINTQAGLDAWPMAKQIKFFQKVLEMEQEYQTAISVETHRSRSTFTPWITRELIGELPDLKLTLDFSHWCCVTERLVLDDDPKLLNDFGKNCWHIHARVGYDQGPQVPDPRAPEYTDTVDRHMAWWRQIWDSLKNRGMERITMTPEFGTDGYLHLEPYTQEPVADLWEINQWMARNLRQRFANWESPEYQPKKAELVN